MLTISIILNVVFLWLLIGTLGALNTANKNLEFVEAMFRDAQLEHQGIKDQFYKERGEL